VSASSAATIQLGPRRLQFEVNRRSAAELKRTKAKRQVTTRHR
jgi:hypothetical protein